MQPPRKLLVIAGREDNIFPIQGVRSAFETVKKIYRQKCKDLHPDVLRSKGLGDFAVKVLEQELQKVNDAYSVIEKYGS